MNTSTEHLSVTTFLPSVQALTALWCHTHRGLLLEDEFELDQGLGMSEATWNRIRAAAIESRVDDITLARETLVAWKFEAVLIDGVLEHCADLLPFALVAVENVWGECLHDEVLENALRAAFDVAAARREQVLADYRPPANDVPSPWHEVHQGCARADAMSRVRVVRAIDRALCRSADRWAHACVDLDHAAQFEAEGKYQDARESLDAAVRGTWSYQNPDRREPAAVALAGWLWRCGELVRTKQLLGQLRGEPARELSRRIEDTAPAREALADAEQAHQERSEVESWIALTLAHLAAGHGIAAERIARELCTEHADDARSWETRARVLHANARYRCAVDPAVKWLDLAPECAPARSLLARAFARVGDVGREPAAEIAAAAVELCESGQGLPLGELVELAEDVCFRAQLGLDWARRADDLIWARRSEREPSVLNGSSRRPFVGVTARGPKMPPSGLHALPGMAPRSSQGGRQSGWIRFSTGASSSTARCVRAIRVAALGDGAHARRPRNRPRGEQSHNSRPGPRCDASRLMRVTSATPRKSP